MIRLGTRGSVLARWQSDWCAAKLRERGVDVEIVVIRTRGDLVQDESIANIGAQGVFTKEIQRALQRGEIDLAVHSLKDLPTDPVDGLRLAAVPRRGPVRDAFLSHIAPTIDRLPSGARIGTGSLRRQTQIRHHFGDRFQIEEIRGNVETRLRKLDAGDYDALVLAEAGLVRLGFADRIRSFLEPPFFLPAVGQGALGLEIRSDDDETARQIETFSDPKTFAAVLAERSLLWTLQGGCIAPIAALGTVVEEKLILHGRILSLDGRALFEATQSISLKDDPETLGVELAEELIERGAGKILEEIRSRRIDPDSRD